MLKVNEIIVTVIGFLCGGGLISIINAVISQNQSNKAFSSKDIDDRIAAWQKISEKNEAKLARLEEKLESYERDIRALERYVQALENALLRLEPSAALPERPVLEREKYV